MAQDSVGGGNADQHDGQHGRTVRVHPPVQGNIDPATVPVPLLPTHRR